MATNQKHDDDFDDDIEALEDDIELDPFLDVMEKQDSKRSKTDSSRRKIEALQEKLRLKKLLEDYPDNDYDYD
jgi:peptidoglycan hydrolase CwlO-like protein